MKKESKLVLKKAFTDPVFYYFLIMSGYFSIMSWKIRLLLEHIDNPCTLVISGLVFAVTTFKLGMFMLYIGLKKY